MGGVGARDIRGLRREKKGASFGVAYGCCCRIGSGVSKVVGGHALGHRAPCMFEISFS